MQSAAAAVVSPSLPSILRLRLATGHSFATLLGSLQVVAAEEARRIHRRLVFVQSSPNNQMYPCHYHVRSVGGAFLNQVPAVLAVLEALGLQTLLLALVGLLALAGLVDLAAYFAKYDRGRRDSYLVRWRHW